jgi:hypothetical protein
MNEHHLAPGHHQGLLAAASLVWAMLTAVSGTCRAATPDLPPAQATSSSAIAQHLMADEKASWTLAIKRDAGDYRAFHAPDFFTVTTTGVVDKIHSEVSAMDANVHFDQCDLSGFDVRFVAQDAALVTYRVKAAGLDHGKAFQLDSYASSLWMKRNGKWLNVFYQATPASSR